jgi:hypothetical protein
VAQGLEGAVEDAADRDRYYGVTLQRKAEGDFRLVSHNMGMFPATRTEPRNKMALIAFNKLHIDVWAWQEVRLLWLVVQQADKLVNRCRIWCGQATAVVGYNTKDSGKSVNQWDGMTIIVWDALSHMIEKWVADPSGLGRWSWMQIKGKEAWSVWVVFMYAPHMPSGPESVGAQH